MEKHTIIGYRRNDSLIPSVSDTMVKLSRSEAVAQANAMVWHNWADYAIVYNNAGDEVYRYER